MVIAIVTGASSGMGRTFVRAIAERCEVDEVWAIARRAERLEALAAETVVPVRALPLDLAADDSYDELGALLEREAPSVLYLVNAVLGGHRHGKTVSQKDTDADFIDVNCRAFVWMTQPVLPRTWCAAGTRRACNSARRLTPLPHPERLRGVEGPSCRAIRRAAALGVVRHGHLRDGGWAHLGAHRVLVSVAQRGSGRDIRHFRSRRSPKRWCAGRFWPIGCISRLPAAACPPFCCASWGFAPLRDDCRLGGLRRLCAARRTEGRKFSCIPNAARYLEVSALRTTYLFLDR